MNLIYYMCLLCLAFLMNMNELPMQNIHSDMKILTLVVPMIYVMPLT